MALTCPSCGNDQNFLVKTLQMHIVQLRNSRVEANEEGRPAVIEVLCDECETALNFADFEEEIRPGVLDLGEDLRQVEVLHTAGRAQLVEEQHGKHKIVKDIRLAGNLKTRVELDCARCLEPVLQDVRHNFDLLYRPQGADAGREELSVTSAEAEVSYYQGEGLQLEDVLREQVILALPLRAICRDDCKGLCPHCGTNLNVEQCACAGPLEDPAGRL